MKRLQRSALALAIMFLLAGCGDRKHPAALVGNWQLDLTQGMIPTQLARFTPAQRQQATALLSGATLTLGHKGEMTSSSPVAAISGSGTWDVEGERLKLASPQAAGRGGATQRTVPYQLLNAGKTLKMGDPGQEVFWKKQ